MDKMVGQFSAEVKRSGFFTEWSMFVDQGLSVETLTQMLMEYLRSPDDGLRKAFTSMLTFMMARPWPVFLKAVDSALEDDERERFQKEGASEKYDRIKLLASVQIEDYWKQFYAEKQAEAKEVLEGLEKLPLAALETKIQIAVKAEVAAQTHVALEQTVKVLKAEIKKVLGDHGEGWKAGGAEV